MTLAGGALLGFWPAMATVSFASTIGATLAFLVSRFQLRDWVQGKFGDKLKSINAGVDREGAFYLYTLRLVPIFPFSLPRRYRLSVLNRFFIFVSGLRLGVDLERK